MTKSRNFERVCVQPQLALVWTFPLDVFHTMTMLSPINFQQSAASCFSLARISRRRLRLHLLFFFDQKKEKTVTTLI